MAEKVNKVLDTIYTQGLDLAIFLDAVCWGNEACISDRTFRSAHTGLMVSDELPEILRRRYKPPRRSHGGKGRRPAGAHCPLLDFATNCVSETVDREMKLSAHLFLSPPEELSEEYLTSLDFGEMKDSIQRDAPVLWRILQQAAYTPEQVARNKHKDPDMVHLEPCKNAKLTMKLRLFFT
jgi:hypothetical protein